LLVANLLRIVSAAVLLTAGASKIGSPGPLSASLGELLGRKSFPRAAGIGVGTVECAVGAIMLSSPYEWSAIPALLLGVVFVTVGIFGRTRRATLPCGCFGSTDSAPLGTSSLMYGSLFTTAGLALLVAATVHRDHRLLWDDPLSRQITAGGLLTVIAVCSAFEVYLTVRRL
jgi:Methylamine utilisation protein MauE